MDLWTFLPLLALAADGLTGDPRGLYARLPHPVVFIGNAIGRADKRFNRPSLPRSAKLWSGALLVAALVVCGAATGVVLEALLKTVPGGWIIAAVLASSLIAARGLHEFVQSIATALTDDLQAGRQAVRHIVSRDVSAMDESAVARSGIESLAENFSDAVVAPLFWLLIAGLPGLIVYKAVNTADSMIGYRNLKHEAFGKAAARTDDVLNWVPARISAVIVAMATLSPRALWIGIRDARHHRSPNAGWPEGAFAGALGIKLAGPRIYDDRLLDAPFTGDGREKLQADDIHAALKLFRRACYVTGGLLAVIALTCL